MTPRYRAWIKSLKWMCDITNISFDSKFVDICQQGDTERYTEMSVEFDEITLMQSTGLFDRNGKEIFEGDVVKRYRRPFLKAKWEYQIETVIKEKASLLLGRKFGKNFWTIPFDSPFAESVLLEVIGNIYENPELLEDK